MSIRPASLSALCVLLLAGAGCAPADGAARTGMANPASVHCGEIGGRSEIRTAADGSQYGVCNMPDGRVCEEWALFRDNKCVPPKA
ncbi:putative hemolysin [Mesorhizobium sp. ASY16-5R]|uniref:putative hemolysin n=1 Tax=Mesorhizobium sp. ASY16-5R TaxID=3445772 RepID=UPI003FA188F0